MAADFDRYQDNYEELVRRSIGFSRQGHEFFVEAKAKCLLALVRRHLGDPSRVRALDVGCGWGGAHRYLRELGELEGVDPSEALIARAREANPELRYHVGDGTDLPFPADELDLTFTVGVLHHVPPEARDAFAGELARVTRPGGLAVVFEHNPLNPLTRLAVSRCEFDDDAILLGLRETRERLTTAGLRSVDAGFILFFPWRGARWARLERALVRVPFGAQYYVAAGS